MTDKQTSMKIIIHFWWKKKQKWRSIDGEIL